MIRFVAFLFVLLGVTVTFGSEKADLDVRKKVGEFVDKEWAKRIKPKLPKPNPADMKSVLWRASVGAPLPAEWPLKTGRLIFYSSARGISLGLRDAEVRGPVWAKVTLDESSKLAIEILTEVIESYGHQGVRPLSKDEIKILSVSPTELLLKKRTEVENESLRAYYRLERKLGNVPELAISENPAFFSWIDAGGGS